MPVTVQGKVVGGLCATMGVILLAIPAGIFISEFLRLHVQRREQRAALNMQGDPIAQLKRQLTAAYELVLLMKIPESAAVTTAVNSVDTPLHTPPTDSLAPDVPGASPIVFGSAQISDSAIHHRESIADVQAPVTVDGPAVVSQHTRPQVTEI